MGWVVDSSAAPWGTLRRALRLINDGVALNPPDDMAYVCSGYAPLSARLVQVRLQRYGRYGP